MVVGAGNLLEGEEKQNQKTTSRQIRMLLINMVGEERDEG